MTCQMCGARVPEGRVSCSQCGAMVGRAPGMTVAAPNASAGLDTVRVCPRCGFHGTSVSYFATGAHIVVLLALAVFTSGIGALIYLLLRGGERICPQCGLKWGRGGYLAPVAPHGSRNEVGPEIAALSDGGGKRGLAWALWAFAALMMVISVAAVEAVPAMFALLAGGAGYLLHRSGNEARERRREALLQSLQLPVLRLAAQRGGRLTVTQVAQDLGWTLPRAEKVLMSMEDGYRVMGDVTPEGVIVYDFPELMHARSLPDPTATMPAPPPPPAAPRLMA